MNQDVPEGWTILPLADIATVVTGSTPPTKNPNFYGGPIPFVKPGDLDQPDDIMRTAQTLTVNGYEVCRPVPIGSTLLCCIGSIGKVGFSGVECATNQQINALIPMAHCTAKWLYWITRTPQFQEMLLNNSSATTIAIVNKGRVERLSVPVPPLSEQRRIVARIEALFARTRRARADLERIAPLSDRHSLTSLRAAVTGQLTVAWRQARPTIENVRTALLSIPAPTQGRGGREATSNVTPGTAALSVNDPGTPPPPGWAWTPLLRVARQETGHTPSRGVASYWDGGDVPWIGIRDAGAHHGTTIYDTMQKCTALGLENSSARLLPTGTVCLSRTASVGYVTVLGKPMATSQDFATWTCTPALLPEFLKFALLAEGDDIRRFGEGSTHTTIYFPEIRALHICLPPVEEQAEIVRILTSNAGGQIVARTEAARTLSLLDRLEQSILARAFRGELVPQDPAEAAAGVADDAEAPAPRRRVRALA